MLPSTAVIEKALTHTESLSWGAVTGIATVALALFAMLTLSSAARDSRERTRPYVVAEFRVVPWGYTRLDLVIRNAGATAARDIVVRFDPPFVETGKRGSLGDYVARRYSEAIPVLGPGQELTSVLHVDLENPEANDVPEKLVVSVEYSKHAILRRKYRDECPLRRVIYTEQIFSVSSASPEGRIKKIAEELSGIREALKKDRSDDSLGSIADAIDDAVVALAPQANGAAWRLRHRKGATFRLTNIGSDSALNVTVEGHESLFGPSLDGPISKLVPGEAVEFIAGKSLATSDSTITVRWNEEAGSESVEKQWSWPLPDEA
jgi:hypothetical protein